jgi:hypothetical protein
LKRKVNRRQHKKLSKNFAARIGGLFTASSGDKALKQKKPKI